MIVKNEEANIGRAIQSFLPFADEIIVNDTGSTDKTMEIVK
jgi:glycosyltransferase involved in cell wall biosynthesis